MTKSPDAFRTISEVADWLGVPAHVLRFWESKFTQVKPVKRAGGRRYYRPADMQLLGGIKTLLHNDGMTIKGVQKMLREQGIGEVSSLSPPLDSELDAGLDNDAPESKVLTFRSRGASRAPIEDVSLEVAETEPQEPAPTPEEITPEETPEPVAATRGEPGAPTAVEPPAEEVLAEPAAGETEPDPTRLPSFLHRPRPPAEPEEPARPRPNKVDAPDPPPDSEVEAKPGILSQLARLDHLTKAQATELAPLAAALRNWLDTAAGHRGG